MASGTGCDDNAGEHRVEPDDVRVIKGAQQVGLAAQVRVPAISVDDFNGHVRRGPDGGGRHVDRGLKLRPPNSIAEATAPDPLQ